MGITMIHLTCRNTEENRNMLLDAGWHVVDPNNPYVYLELDIFNLCATIKHSVRSMYRNVDSTLLSQILIMPTTDARQAFCTELMREHLQAIEHAISTGNPKPITYPSGYMASEES